MVPDGLGVKRTNSIGDRLLTSSNAHANMALDTRCRIEERLTLGAMQQANAKPNISARAMREERSTTYG